MNMYKCLISETKHFLLFKKEVIIPANISFSWPKQSSMNLAITNTFQKTTSTENFPKLGRRVFNWAASRCCSFFVFFLDKL